MQRTVYTLAKRSTDALATTARSGAVRAKSRPFPLIGLLALLLFFTAGCGGGGNPSSDGSGDGGGGGGGETRLAVQNDLRFVVGTAIGEYTASSVPQAVRIRVGGVERTVENVVVVRDVFRFGSDTTVSVLLEGSKLLNVTIPDPSRGVTFPETTIRAPITGEGVLQASVLFSSNNGRLTTPVAKWQGFDLPGGVTVSWVGPFDAGSDYRAAFDASPILPTGAATDLERTGSGTFSYSSPTNTVSASVDLSGNSGGNLRRFAVGSVASTALPSSSGSLSVPWTATRLGDVVPLSAASVQVTFLN